MKKNYVLLMVLLTLVATTQAQIVAQFNSPTTGTLSGVPFEFTNLANTNGPSFNADLSGADFSAAPLSNSENMFQVNQMTNWTVTFNSPIEGLRLYCKFWRDGDVEFDQAFTILSGGTNFTNPSGNVLRTVQYTDGVIEFTNPVTTLNLTHLTSTVDGFEGVIFGLEQMLSVDEFQINPAKKIVVYPNPSSDYIQVSGLKTTENYTIYNTIGQVIKTGTVFNKEAITIKSLTKGLYFISLGQIAPLKFIKE